MAKIFSGCNEEIRRTWGVVMGMAVIDEEQATLTYGGIGNTSAQIIGGDQKRLASDPGIVAAGFKEFTARPIKLSPGQIVVMHTNGFRDKFDISGYGADYQDDLSQLAAEIIADWGQDTDDCAVLVYRYGGPKW